MNTTFVAKQLPDCNYRKFNEHHKRIAQIMSQLSDFKDELIINSFRLEVGLSLEDKVRSNQNVFVVARNISVR